MFLILRNNKLVNIKPEIDYAGQMIPLRLGYFLHEITNDEFVQIENIKDNKYVTVDGQSFSISNNLIFTDKKIAEINFLKLKMREMSENSYAYFMPESYLSFINEFSILLDEYPEFFI